MRVRNVTSVIAVALLALLVVAVLVSLLDTNRGSVRMLDMLREPSIYLAAGLAIVGIVLARDRRWLVLGLATLAIGINLFKYVQSRV